MRIADTVGGPRKVLLLLLAGCFNVVNLPMFCFCGEKGGVLEPDGVKLGLIDIEGLLLKLLLNDGDKLRLTDFEGLELLLGDWETLLLSEGDRLGLKEGDNEGLKLTLGLGEKLKLGLRLGDRLVLEVLLLLLEVKLKTDLLPLERLLPIEDAPCFEGVNLTSTSPVSNCCLNCFFE